MPDKALGKHNRKGIILIEIFQKFPDDATAEKLFLNVRWPNGVHCPHCESINIQTGAKHKTMPFQCKNNKICGKRFSITADIKVEGSNLDYQV